MVRNCARDSMICPSSPGPCESAWTRDDCASFSFGSLPFPRRPLELAAGLLLSVQTHTPGDENTGL